MIGQMRAGDVILLTTAASVQFLRPITVRVIRELPDRHTYDGWVWIDGYESSAAGDAVARRELFVMRGGVQLQAHPAAPSKPRPAHRQPIRRGPVRVG
ncbi:hypothetical protein [Micromonospora sp. NPDC049171]|uniref:hypothetical protein n=1 Tax=Micromonospora sp. NPDC049171 TaxID=3155770 RepID=UPI0033C5119B